MGCSIGRAIFDPQHPTCRSCQKQDIGCRKPKAAKPPLQVYPIGNRLVVTKDLRTPNDWTGAPNGKAIYRRERSEWGKILQGTRRKMGAALILWGKATGKRRLTVIRYTRRPQDFIKDVTNREGSLKPLEDALVKAGVLIDDRDEFMERPPLRQEVDARFPRVEIILEDL